MDSPKVDTDWDPELFRSYLLRLARVRLAPVVRARLGLWDVV
jgi:hypothetical protein